MEILAIENLHKQLLTYWNEHSGDDIGLILSGRNSKSIILAGFFINYFTFIEL